MLRNYFALLFCICVQVAIYVFRSGVERQLLDDNQDLYDKVKHAVSTAYYSGKVRPLILGLFILSTIAQYVLCAMGLYFILVY